MAKQMIFQSDARDAMRQGVEKLAKAVTTTLGPRGRNAVLDKGWGAPTVTKDGVSVAEEIKLQDPYEQMGASLVKEVASKSSKDRSGRFAARLIRGDRRTGVSATRDPVSSTADFGTRTGENTTVAVI